VLYFCYAFGAKLTLHADRLEYQSLFLFKRTLQRHHIHQWQLQIDYVRSAEIFMLVLKSHDRDMVIRDMVIELNFVMDGAFYAWFPGLETLVHDRWNQFPALRRIST
jgi:hypothetical protein